MAHFSMKGLTLKILNELRYKILKLDYTSLVEPNEQIEVSQQIKPVLKDWVIVDFRAQ